MTSTLTNKALILPFSVCLIIGLVLLPTGFALKCYSCDNPETCKNPGQQECVKQGRLPAPDRCWIHRETEVVNGAKVVVKDKRQCMYAYQCVDAFHCNKSNTDVDCEAGCCKGDLCNHHNFKPAKITYSKPNGADLSCYSCSDLPESVLRKNLPVESAKCSKPVKKTCGVSTLHDDIVQDRCITLDVVVQLPNDQKKEKQYRTCADLSFCANSDESWNFILHDEMGSSPKVKSSCCVGNLCNNGDVTGPTTCMTCLAGLLALLVKYLM